MSKYIYPPDEVKRIWKLTCNDLKLKLSEASYTTWILTNPLVELKINDQNQAQGTISALTAFHATNLKKNLYNSIKKSLEKVTKKPTNLQFKINYKSNKITEDNKSMQSPREILKNNQKKTHHLQRSINNKTINENSSLFSQNTIQASLQDRAILSAKRIGLRINSTFKTFAVSTSNEMAHAAAIAVSKKPGMAYNPLFFYGGVGVGKTHLMHAIAHNILRGNPTTNIIYCTGEEFTNSIINAIQTKKTIQFKQKYRNTQVLLIDDIQFLAGKTAVQEEFFHTFNALIKNFSQIVLTSDKPPTEIQLLEDRLRSRFEAGLMIDIGQPSIELRTAIVLIKSQERGLQIPIDLAQMIADKIKSARKIEGIITSVHSEIALKGKEISANLIQSLIQRESETAQTTQILRIKPSRVIKRVSKYYQLKPIQVKGRKRQKNIVKARHVAMYVLKKDCKLSYTEIGKWFSNRDHTSIMHAVKKIDEELNENPVIQEELTSIKLSLNGK
jgi:chromosomal replication initiator protein